MASNSKSDASAPFLLQTTEPIAPVTLGVGEVQAVFSGVEASASPATVTVELSATSLTVTVKDTLASFSSESVAVTCTS